MATNNNKQQKRMQLQNMLGLQLHSRDSHAGNSVITGEGAYSQKVQPNRGHPTGRYAPTGLTGQLRPLLARRDDQVTYRGPDTDGSPISRLVQSIGTRSNTAAGRNKINTAADNTSSSEFGQDRQSTVCSGLDTVRPVLKMFLRPNTNLETYTMESEVGCDFVKSGQTAVCDKSATNVRICHKSSQENVKRECTEFLRNEELQQQLLSDKELELQRLYQFQQQEKDRTKKLNAQVQKDIELQLSQARQELELQRRKNAELEKDLMKHRDVYQEMALQQILEDQASKGARKKWSSQLDQDEYKMALDRAVSKQDQNQQLCSATGQSTLQHVPDTGLTRNQQRNSLKVPLQTERLDPLLSPRRTKPGTSDERLAQLLVMQKLEALKQKFDSATETQSVSDLEERMVRGERHYERRSVRRSDSDNDSDMSGRSENSQHEDLNSQHQRLDRHRMHRRLRNNWQSHRIGDAFRNQSSLMQMVETAATVNTSPQLAQNRRGFESDAGGADMEVTGRRLRSRLDFDRFHHQRDTGDDSSPLHRQQDYRHSSFQEKNGQLFDRAQQIHQRRMESQLHRLRSRSCERVNSRSRHSSALLMSSSSGRPIGKGLNRLLEESMDSDDSQKGYVRNVMEVDVSYTSSEEESGDEAEKTVQRQNPRKSEDQLSPPPSDDDTNAGPSQKGMNRRNSRRSLRIEDDDTIGENPRRSIGNKDVAANSDSKSPIQQSGKQMGNYPGTNKMIPRRSIGSEDAKANSDPSSRRRNSTKIPETENVKDTSRPRRSIGNDDEMASTDQRYPKRQSQKLSETDYLQDESRSVPRRSIGQGEKMGYTDPVRQPEKQFKNLKGMPRRSIGTEDEIDYDDQSRLKKQPEKRQSPLEIKSSSSPGKSDPGSKNQNLPPNRKTGKVAGNGGAGRRNSKSNGPESIPEEWSGRPAVSQYPSLSDDNSNTDENADRRSGLKMFKLPDPQKRVVLDSDDDDDIDEEEERRRRLKRKPSRRPSKLSVTSKTSRNAEPQTADDHRESRTVETATHDNPSDRPRRHSEKSIKPIATTAAAAVDGGKNVDSRFQDARKATGQLNTEIDMPSKELESRKKPTLQSFDTPQRQPTTPNSENDARLSKDNDSEVQLALKEKTLNTSMKLGIDGEQTELQPTQEEEEEPNSALSGQRNSWRSKHNKAAPDSYTQDSEHRGLYDDTRDTDSDTRSTLPPQNPYALRPEAGGKVQLLTSRFLQHQAKVQQKKKAEEESTDASPDSMKREASKPGAAATSKVRDEKTAVSIQEKKALAKSVSRLPATEGGAVLVKPEDTLTGEDIEACKTRAQRKNEERRKRRENKEAAHTAPVSEDEDDDDDLAPVMQQESMGEQLRQTPKEPEDGDVAPMTGDVAPVTGADAPVQPDEKPGGTEGVMALERQRIHEKQQTKPRAPKPSKPKDEPHIAQAPIAPARPHKRRRRRRSSRLEPLARSVSLPPQPTVIYCCPPCPPCPPRCCYPAAAYCSVGCRRC